MILAGMMTVRNEAELIERNLRYHLQDQEFDMIVVVDNGSHDGTLDLVRGFGDRRVGLVEAGDEAGFSQDVLFTRTAESLLRSGTCDWLVPFDADEFWTGGRGSMKRVLSSLPEGTEAAYASLLQIRPTVEDDASIADPFLRSFRGNVVDLPRALVHRSIAPRFKAFPFGAHRVFLKDDARPRAAVLDPDLMARAHYNNVDRDLYRRRIMSQAEGYMVRFGLGWLADAQGRAERVREWYVMVKEGRFDEEYDRRIVADEARLACWRGDGSYRELPALGRRLAELGRAREARK